MAKVNADKARTEWSRDTIISVSSFNAWFTRFAPSAYAVKQAEGVALAKTMLLYTNNLRNITSESLRSHPQILPTLRMSTRPPLARDRLAGLSATDPNNESLAEKMESVVDNMDQQLRLPPSMTSSTSQLAPYLRRIADVIRSFLDMELFPWLESDRDPTDAELTLAIKVLADRHGSAAADPVIRNEPEKLQIVEIENLITPKGYRRINKVGRIDIRDLPPGTFTKMSVKGGVPIDIVIQPLTLRADRLPILIEAKGAGDYANTNKRRKEEADKMFRLKGAYGDQVPYILYLWGYFNSTYLQHEADAGLDWVWHHRVADLEKLGI